MPPIKMFGRKWNVATDDFVYLSFTEFLIQLSLILLYLFYVNYNEFIVICNIGIFFKILHFVLGGIILCNLISNVALMILSARGSILEENKRTKVPACLYIKLLLFIIEILSSIPCFAETLRLKKKFDICNSKITELQKIVFITLIVLLFFYISLLYLFFDNNLDVDKSIGNILFNNIVMEKRKKLCKNRLKCLLCLCRPNVEEKSALDTAATILTSIFEDPDLIHSDYISGLQLLRLEDTKVNNIPMNLSHEQNGNLMKCISSIEKSVENESYRTSKGLPPNSNFETKKRISEESIHRMADWRNLQFVYYFARLAKATYGWPLQFMFPNGNKSVSNICSGCSHSNSYFSSLCKCCKYERSDSNDQHRVYSKGHFCSFHETVILNHNLLKNENLVCASFYNKMYYSPFFITISHEIQVIVISIRGTLSVKDILTDMNVKLTNFDEEHLHECFAHSGITFAALNIRKILREKKILQTLIEENKNYRLIITGHSLGAGIAVVLSCLLFPEYPNLKCYAFSPPLGTSNIKMADFCKNFVLTIVNGYDWVPRISLETLMIVKKRLVNSLHKYPHSKFRLSMQRLFPCKCKNCAQTNLKWNIVNVHKRDCELWKDVEMSTKLPGQIIHIAKKKILPNRRKSKSCCKISIITSSEEFHGIIFHPKMFVDHLPHKIVNSLYKILKNRNDSSTIYHHSLDHYWQENEKDNEIILPNLNIFKKENNTTHMICNSNNSNTLQYVSSF